jgi:hypothetical protein
LSEFTQVAFAITGYRVFTITTGLVFAYLGYKLFCKGIYEQSGDLKATWGKYTLVLRQAAPGIFFALFGVIVISISLIQGIDIERIRSLPSAAGVPVPGNLPYLFQSFIPRTRMTKEIQVIVQKAVDGKALEAEERKKLRQWVRTTMHQQRQQKERYQAYEPPGVSG